LAKLRREIPFYKLMSEAKDAMKAGRLDDALRSLNEAAKLAEQAGVIRDHNSIYWLRAQAHLGLDRIAEAKRDVELYAGLLDSNSSSSDIKAGKKLREMVAQAQSASLLKGFLDRAKQAMEAGRFRDALQTLNDAANKVPDNDVVLFIRAQANLALGNVTGARQDAKRVAELAETDEDIEAAVKLEQFINQWRS
jgi:tetratricopeptide (TPR) repeat protein